MKFTVDNGEKDLSASLPAAVEKMIKALKAMPDGKLLTTRALAARTGYSKGIMHTHGAHPALKPFKLRIHATVCYYGNPVTIAAARKEFNEE